MRSLIAASACEFASSPTARLMASVQSMLQPIHVSRGSSRSREIVKSETCTDPVQRVQQV